jgi:hypothetical protein
MNKEMVEGIDVDLETERLTDIAREYMQLMPIEVLVAAVNEIIDLNAIAEHELQNRGLDTSGTWIGFTR